MITLQHAVTNIANSTPAPRRGPKVTRTDISLDRLAEACASRGVDINDIIAEALTPEREESMGFRQQADLAWKVMDKLEASKKAIEVEGGEKPILIEYIRGDDAL
jgi:hypothetical protein